VDLSSPQRGDLIPDTCPAVIQWTIQVNDNSGPFDPHLGLAMFSVDFVQDPANPELFDIPLPAAVPPPMAGFSPPAGLGKPAGYLGTPVGEPGQRNIAQIGGAQNTLGAPGAIMGQDVNVDGGVSLSGWQVVAIGSFDVPTTHGEYTFRVESAVANVLEAIHPPPQFSPTSEIPVLISRDSFSFTVVCAGDLNGDDQIDLSDYTLFIQAFHSSCGAPQYDPLADLNCDCAVDFSDATIFFQVFQTSCP
jgi:hypothetical protein